MLRKTVRAIVFTVTVLVTYLIVGGIEDRILSETERFRPLTATLLGMLCIVIVFVPISAFLEKATDGIVKSLLRTTRQSAGKILGLILFVLFIFTLLFAIFLDRWFDISLVSAL